jgi:hypothetical protein
MNWEPIRDALLEAIQVTSGVEPKFTAWVDEPAGAAFRAFPNIDLAISSVHGFGDDEIRIDRTVDPPVERISGPRQFTLTVKVEGESVHTHDAMTVMGRIRARLRRTSVLDALTVAGVAIASFEDEQIVSYKANGQPYVAVVLDILCNAAENDISEEEPATDPIESAQIDSQYLTDPDGSNNPGQISKLVET